MAENSYLPQTGDDLELVDFALEQQPSYTYKLDIDRGRVKGMTDEADALLQAVYLALGIERYDYLIYSWNYGVEISDLIGQPEDYVMSEVKRRIKDALTQDDRITDVDDWLFESNRNSLTVKFTVHSVYGNIQAEKEVKI